MGARQAGAAQSLERHGGLVKRPGGRVGARQAGAAQSLERHGGLVRRPGGGVGARQAGAAQTAPEVAKAAPGQGFPEQVQRGRPGPQGSAGWPPCEPCRSPS